MLVLAASGTGKSTLVSHLVGQGFDLVNDEQVVLDGVSGMVHSFTRPVVAKVGAWALPAGAATGRVESLVRSCCAHRTSAVVNGWWPSPRWW
ncbi:MAG: hypothetical protein IPG97_15645 [Microthrixaceae bacterium]|nr:hypothetical protein [Microthrixaceae bacterium]